MLDSCSSPQAQRRMQLRDKPQKSNTPRESNSRDGLHKYAAGARFVVTALLPPDKMLWRLGPRLIVLLIQTLQPGYGGEMRGEGERERHYRSREQISFFSGTDGHMKQQKTRFRLARRQAYMQLFARTSLSGSVKWKEAQHYVAKKQACLTICCCWWWCSCSSCCCRVRGFVV